MQETNLIPNKELKVIHADYTPSFLPWDLRTILDLELKIDDIQILQADVPLGIGEVILLLIDEGVR